MSDEIENKSGYQTQSSETMNEYSGAAVGDVDYVRPAEIPEQEEKLLLNELRNLIEKEKALF